MREYRHKPLPDDLGSIRLLRLLPNSDDEAEIRCDIFDYELHTSRQTPHQYDALSYVWGDTKILQMIYIGDEYFEITLNLYAALRRLRDPNFPRVLWVDAVCINQVNNQEKGHQIRLMPRIYSTASQVVVWLGEAEDGNDEAFEAIRVAGMRAHQQLRQTHVDDNSDYASPSPDDNLGSRSNVEDLFSDKTCNAVTTLLQRQWFQRIWILQEVAAARYVLIICGQQEIDGYALCLGLDTFQHYQRSSSKSKRTAAKGHNDFFHRVQVVLDLIHPAIFRPRSIPATNEEFSLAIQPMGMLLDSYHTHAATKRHDKIYALLGMCTDTTSENHLLPDYTLPFDQLIQRAMHFVLGQNIRVNATVDSEEVGICCLGHVLGRINDRPKYTHGRVSIEMCWTYIRGEQQTSSLIVSAVANPIQRGDIVCMLQGASQPSVIRRNKRHFSIVILVFKPLSTFLDPWKAWDASLSNVAPRSFFLVWILGSLPERSNASHLGELNTPLSLWHTGIILRDAELPVNAERKLLEAVKSYRELSGVREEIVLTDDVFIDLAVYFGETLLVNILNQTAIKICLSEPLLIRMIEEVEVANRGIEVLVKHRPKEIHLTEPLMNTILRSNNGHIIIDPILQHRSQEVKITEPFLITVAASSQVDSILSLLLLYKLQDIYITEPFLLALARNDRAHEATWLSLFDHLGENMQITEPILLAAGKRPPWCCPRLMSTLFSRKAEEIQVTQSLVEEAVRNGCWWADLEVLLAHRSEEIRITETMLLDGTSVCWYMAIEVLLKYAGAGVRITDSLLLASAERGSSSGYWGIMKVFLYHGESVSRIPEAVFLTVISTENPYWRQKALDIIFARQNGNNIEITEAVLVKAVQNSMYAEFEILWSILHPSKIKLHISEEVIIAAVHKSQGNDDCYYIKRLLEYKGPDEKLSEETIHKAIEPLVDPCRGKVEELLHNPMAWKVIGHRPRPPTPDLLLQLASTNTKLPDKTDVSSDNSSESGSDTTVSD